MRPPESTAVEAAAAIDRRCSVSNSMALGSTRRRSNSVTGSTAGLVIQTFQMQAEAVRMKEPSSSSRNSNQRSPPDLLQSLLNSAPGCYQGDDGSADIAERYNFFVHGKRFLFAPCSLGIFPESSRFRQAVIWCITWKRFDQFILLLIAANSIILAIADYSKVDNAGDLDSSQSYRNAIVNYADSMFTVLFSVECTLKIIGMGMFGDKGAYLADPWNCMDFVVVFIGILAVIPGIPNVSVLRTFRVLRPLRSVNAVAGMKKLVTALLRSIPELLTVVAFLCFLFFLYGVIGVQLWSGVLHARCRLTPYPVALNSSITFKEIEVYQASVLANYSHFICTDDSGHQIPVESPEWSHDSSPWRTPRVCYWPLAPQTTAQTCALGSDSYRQCPSGQTCGSDFDSFGNVRFTHPDSLISRNILNAATYNADLGWGYVNFDHIGFAALAIFQCITREGWSDIMYTLQDAGYGVVSMIYFVSFIIIGSFFMLNLTLAVIWENFSDASIQEAEERKKLDEIALTQGIVHRRLQARKSNYQPPFGAFIRWMICHRVFNAVRTILILLNTIILSLDQYPADEAVADVVEVANFGLTITFLLEWALKLIGLGWTEWRADRYNWFDALVVIVGMIEIALSPPGFFSGVDNNAAKATAFSGLRSVRLFALFKLTRSWPSLHKLLSTMVSTIKEVGNFSVLFLLFMYIYALIGMQTFANKFRFNEFGYPATKSDSAFFVPRSNFDTMLWSMVTVFQILTGENWNVVMLDGWRSSGWSAVLYFISLVVFGNFIVLNLFLAILLGNFEETSDDDKREEREREELKRKARIVPAGSHGRSGGDGMWRSEREPGGGKSEREQAFRSMTNVSARSDGDNFPRVASVSPAFHRSSKSRRSSTTHNVFQDHVPASQRTRHSANAAKKLTNRSLMIFSTRNLIRKICIKLITHPQFDNVSLVLIAISTVSLAIDNPLNPPDSFFVLVLSWIDTVLTVLFMVEVVVKVIAQGFLFDENAYMRNNWNVMDLIITTLAAISLGEGRGRFKFVKTLRTFRALRPLRMINRNPGLKLVVSSLIASIPQIINVIMVCFLVFTIFSIVAVNNLKGMLYSCQGDEFDSLSAAQQQLITYPRLWSNLTMDEQDWFDAATASVYANITDSSLLTSRVLCGFFGAAWHKTIPQDFDNVLRGIQTFFEMTTTEGWVTIMLASVDATGIDMQPVENNSELWSLFFIAFIMVGTFFVMQLFVGVVIENFNRMKEKLDGTYLLTAAQREWLIINESMLNLRPLRKMKVPHDKVRRQLFRLAQNPTFDLAIAGCIVLNTVIMALHYFGEEDIYRKSIEISNYVFAMVFTMEAVIKVIGLGRYYWKDSWNIFDFIVVIGTFVGIVYQLVAETSFGTLATTIRSVRVGRLFRLIQSAPSLRQLFNTLLITLPSLVNIGGLLFLVFFIYAAMGVQLFAKVKLGELVTPTTNFQSISRAMITLVRCATGERWNDVMYELASQDNCTPDPSYDPMMCGFSDDPECISLNGCGSPVAFVYLYSFTLLVTFILLNIFIAVILEGFANEKDRTNGILLPQHYDNFVATWALFDPEATGFIDWYALPSFLSALDPPMGFDKSYKPTAKEVTAVIELLDVPIFRSNKVFFNDVARRIGKFVVDEMIDEPLKSLPASLNMEQRWRKYLLSRKVKRQDHTMYRVNQFHAAQLIHLAVKALIFREDLKHRLNHLDAKMHALTSPMAEMIIPATVEEAPQQDEVERENSTVESADDILMEAEDMLREKIV